MTGPTTHREVERKLRVHGLFEMPDLVKAGVAASTSSSPTFSMKAVYHDTTELTLFRWGITLRRREGGGDAGWHMKLPVAGADGSARDEMRMPLDSGAVGSVPGALVEVVAPLLHELPLVPVVVLQTERTPTVVFDADGRESVEVVDDVVTVTHDGRVVSVFREVEIESIDPEDPQAGIMTDAISRVLLSMGAEPSSVSKAASALGPRTAEPPDVPAVPSPGPSGLAVDAIRAVLSEHVRHLLMADIGVRRDIPDSVHQMRVASRRLRSALATFGPLLDEAACSPIREELQWLANELGAIRDTEVLMERLDDHAGALPDADSERCRVVIDSALGSRIAAAKSSALAALRSDRHQQLIDDLMIMAVAPPVVDRAYLSCDETLLPLVTRTWRHLERSIAAIRMDGPSEPWHAARIKAKRARYAAEAVAPVFGKKLQRLSRSLAEVTEVLGDHQDAHIAKTTLRELALLPDTSGSAGLSLGLLYAFESDVELDDRLRFSEVWSDARHRARTAEIT